MEASTPITTELENEPVFTGEVEHESNFEKWGSLVILSLALAIIIIDTTLLNVSIGTIIRELHTNIQSIQWVITAYALILAAFTITGGRLGDLFGKKRMFVLGAVIFALGSFIASISHSVGTLIWGEAIIEGIGAALMMPATSSLLVATFKGRERAIAFGIWGGIAAASSAIGPILGGFLTTHYSWRWGFRINVFVAALVLLGSMLIRESRDTKNKPGLDFVGIVLSSLGLLSMVFGFIKASDYGWFKAKEQLVLFGHALNLGSLSVVPLFVLLGLVFIGLFLLWEQYITRKGKTPLVSLSLFKNRQFISGATTMSIQTLGMSGMIFAVPVFLQAVRGLDAYHTGLAMLPLSLALLVAAPASAAISKKVSPKLLIQIGLFINAVSYFFLRNALSVDAVASDFILGFVVFGIGMGMVMAQISNLTLSAVPVKEAGEASGVNNTLRQVGSTLGSAIIGAILLSSLATNLGKGIEQSTVLPQAIKPALSQTIGKELSSVEFGGGDSNAQKNTLPFIRDEINKISKQATVDANKTSLLYGALFGFLGFITSFFIPKIDHTHAPVAPTGEATSAAPLTIVPEKRKRSWRGLACVLAVLILAGLTAGVVYAFKHKPSTTTNTITDVAIAPPQAEVSSPVDTTPPPTDQNVVLSEPPAPVPVQNPPPVPQNFYTDSDFGVTVTYAKTWSNVAVKRTSNSLLFYNSVSGVTYGVITKYGDTHATQDSIVQTLQLSPDVTSTTPIMISGFPAVVYTVKGTKNIAVIKHGLVLYITNMKAEDFGAVSL